MTEKNLRLPPPIYKAIIEWVKKNKGYTISHPCWIADVKEQMGYPMREAPNRQGSARAVPCPAEKIADIKEAINKAP